MVDIAFHFNVGNSAAGKLGYACRLMRKAVAARARVMVLGEPEVVAQLDQLLWTFAPLEFVAHCVAGAPGTSAQMLASSPVVLCTHEGEPAHQDVLLNLRADIPEGFAQFRRVIEIVSLEDADRQAARLRWKRYVELGFTITRHDIALQGGGD